MPAPAPKSNRQGRRPRQITKAERKRYLETAQREAKRHRRTLAALAK